jgi:hypothetical protein
MPTAAPLSSGHTIRILQRVGRWTGGEEPPLARGMNCPQCGTPMWAKSEKDEPAGTEVLYECNSRTCGFTVRKFEDK